MVRTILRTHIDAVRGSDSPERAVEALTNAENDLILLVEDILGQRSESVDVDDAIADAEEITRGAREGVAPDDVAERLGTGLQNRLRGFNSRHRLSVLRSPNPRQGMGERWVDSRRAGLLARSPTFVLP